MKDPLCIIRRVVDGVHEWLFDEVDGRADWSRDRHDAAFFVLADADALCARHGGVVEVLDLEKARRGA